MKLTGIHHRLVHPAPFYLKNALRGLATFFDERISSTGRVGDINVFLESEGSLMGLMILADDDYEDMNDSLPPNVLEFDCRGAIDIICQGEDFGNLDDSSQESSLNHNLGKIKNFVVEAGEIKSSGKGMLNRIQLLKKTQTKVLAEFQAAEAQLFRRCKLLSYVLPVIFNAPSDTKVLGRGFAYAPARTGYLRVPTQAAQRPPQVERNLHFTVNFQILNEF